LRAFGYTLRLFNPEAYLGNTFKLKPEDGGFFSDWPRSASRALGQAGPTGVMRDPRLRPGRGS
jgi:hypothetical protein